MCAFSIMRVPLIVVIFCACLSHAYVSELYKYFRDYELIYEEDTLILAHVIFRHGDRTPDVSTIYPTDPYANETYPPFGKGQLTLTGKERAYRLGELLRYRYNAFLGRDYLPDLIEARSSSYPRTQATLALVLASLFVPSEEYKIRQNLLWQPIPIVFEERERDKLIATFISCPKLFDEVERVQMTSSALMEFERNRRLYEYLSENSGWNVNSTTLASYIYNTLQTESEWGFELPAWTRWVFPHALKRVTNDFWRHYASTTTMRRMAVGNLLQKIINDTAAKMENQLPADRKLYLYSGHDFNIIPLMAALGNVVTESPYTAHVILELHKINERYFIKAFYGDYTSREPRLLTIQGCEQICPFETFVNLMQPNLPRGDELC